MRKFRPGMNFDDGSKITRVARLSLTCLSYRSGVCQSQSVSVMEVKLNHVRPSTASYQLPHPPKIPAQATLFVCASGKIRLQPRLVIRFLQFTGRQAGMLGAPCPGALFSQYIVRSGHGYYPNTSSQNYLPHTSHNSY